MEAQTITPENEVSSLNQFQQQALEAAEKELADLELEMSTKKYLVDIDKNDIAMLDSFIKKDAPWKFTESLGIIEVEKSTVEAVKEGKLFTTSLAIEAIYYYMSKVEGAGKTPAAGSFKTVENYVRILKGITGTMERVKVDNEKVKNAQFVVAARREGIEPDTSIETK
jgi:hypothetical protein